MRPGGWLFLLWSLQVWAYNSLEALTLTEVSSQSEDFIIRIEDGNLDLFTGVRDYYTLVILTSTLDKHNCVPCKGIMDGIKRVSKNYFKDYKQLHQLFFVEIDLVHEGNRKIANDLQLASIPHVWLVPPNPKEQYEPLAILKEQHFVFKVPKGSVANQALELARLLSQTLNKSIYVRDEDPLTQFILYFSVTFLSITILKRRGPKIVTNLGKPMAWRIIAIGAILSSITGYQFTKIKKVPFIARNEKGIMFISGGHHYQFGTEIVIVSANYILLGVATLFLIYLGNYKPHERSKFQKDHIQILITINCVVLYIFYSCLTSIALRKDPYYPYHFTKFF
ncbi:dolichyl-diphosphooligosaccharide--protein glycosyltransferase subunit Ost6p [[Candida] jaroonii]|uniref:Dolichyl-diphosphooligosaccharide--protein glycosyltransferase subunit Ost6p n=1 Tax=[Candida] jaroonii TaxID=467808 RepID=A0ACA9Y874_9ASCO|nr:dolichyl-diphosphooligosaccharide--protein glycosyltransferase subunit Ost6p [[Candida] jaroonii]